MAKKEHLEILKRGVEVWNKWREENPDVHPDLCGADLNGAELEEADLSGTWLNDVKLSQANLSQANLAGAQLYGANMSGPNLIRSDMGDNYLERANLKEADLEGANLQRAILIETNLEEANLKGCQIYGISAWNLKLKGTKQENLVVSQENEPIITVDNLEVAQFIYLLLNNEKIRDVIDTITSKVVLILGRFTKPRKAVLDAIRNELRQHNYLPILFDFDKPASKDLTETISTLAHMARFIIADISEPKCIPHELATVVPTLSVPVKPLLLKGSTGEYAMFKDLRQKYHWVLAVYRYNNSDELIESLEPKVIVPAEKKARALIKRKNR